MHFHFKLIKYIYLLLAFKKLSCVVIIKKIFVSTFAILVLNLLVSDRNHTWYLVLSTPTENAQWLAGEHSEIFSVTKYFLYIPSGVCDE